MFVVGRASRHAVASSAIDFATKAACFDARRCMATRVGRYEKVPKVASACQGRSAEVQQEEEFVGDVRYSRDQRLLLVGEADFSFAGAVCSQFGDDCSNVTATAYESQSELRSRFGRKLLKRVEDLESRLCGITYDVDCCTLHTRFRPASFDRITFNFPLGGRVGSSASRARIKEPTDAEERKTSHGDREREAYESLSQLLEGFFASASAVLKLNGECHVRLTDKYATARGLRAAEEHGMVLKRRVDFMPAFKEVYMRLGYRPVSVTRGDFDLRHSSTFVFRRVPGVCSIE